MNSKETHEALTCKLCIENTWTSSIATPPSNLTFQSPSQIAFMLEFSAFFLCFVDFIFIILTAMKILTTVLPQIIVHIPQQDYQVLLDQISLQASKNHFHYKILSVLKSTFCWNVVQIKFFQIFEISLRRQNSADLYRFGDCSRIVSIAIDLSGRWQQEKLFSVLEVKIVCFESTRKSIVWGTSRCYSVTRSQKSFQDQFPNDKAVARHWHTMFENHWKSLIQHCERSELRLHFEWTKVD